MGIVFIAFGIAAIFVTFKIKNIYRLALRNARPALGQIVTHVKKYSGSRTLHPLIKVNLAGHDRHFISPIGSFPPSGKPSDQIQVLLDPKDSNRATVQMNFVPMICNIVSVVGLVFIGFGINMLISQKMGTFLYVDLAFGAFFVGMGFYKYKNLSKSRNPLNKKIENLIRNESIYEEFQSEEEVEKILAGEHIPIEKFGKFSEKLSATEQYRLQKKAKPNQSGGLVAASLMGLIGVGLIVGGIWKAQDMYEFKQTALRAPGKIIDRKVNRGSGTTYTPIISYSPLNQEQVYKFKGAFSSSHPSWNVGDEVYVLYDPSLPHEAIQEDGLWNYVFSFFFGLLGLFFTAFGWAVLSNNKSKKQGPIASYKRKVS